MTPYTGPERRQRAASGPELSGAHIWASLKDHRVPPREPRPSPRMAHWDSMDQLGLWE